MLKNKKDQTVTNLTPTEAFNFIKEHENDPYLIILDVRTPWEFSKEHIDRAENLDFTDPDFNENVENLDKDKIYIIYCKSGRRSDKVMEIFRNLGFNNLYSIKGGFEGWKSSNLNYEM
jgi:rhodanese-related sulfurtransferase